MRSEPTPTHTRSLANHRNRAGVDVCVSGGGFDYEVDAQPIAAIANRIVERVGHGLGLHTRLERAHSFRESGFGGENWAEVIAAKMTGAAIDRMADANQHQPDANSPIVPFLLRRYCLDTVNSLEPKEFSLRGDANRQIPNFPQMRHLLALPRNEASGDGRRGQGHPVIDAAYPSIAVHLRTAQKDAIAIIAGAVEVMAAGVGAAERRALQNAPDEKFSPILRSAGDIPPPRIPILPKALEVGHAHLPNPRSQSPATRAAGCDKSRAMSRAIPRTAAAAAIAFQPHRLRLGRLIGRQFAAAVARDCAPDADDIDRAAIAQPFDPDLALLLQARDAVVDPRAVAAQRRSHVALAGEDIADVAGDEGQRGGVVLFAGHGRSAAMYEQMMTQAKALKVAAP